jgi:hypothetical protein
MTIHMTRTKRQTQKLLQNLQKLCKKSNTKSEVSDTSVGAHTRRVCNSNRTASTRGNTSTELQANLSCLFISYQFVHVSQHKGFYIKVIDSRAFALLSHISRAEIPGSGKIIYSADET